ncbi:MAG: PHP domain-containing protein [Treponemataceae bacterium]
MIFDLHFHTADYSPCSRMRLAEGVKRASEIGLDGICITEHDVFPAYSDLDELRALYGIAIFVGIEIYSLEGDILCFGLDRVPSQRIGARDLTAMVAESGGATIAAHPYRDNNRGVGDLLFDLPHLTAVEAFNGNTSDNDNARALRSARERGLRVTGSSDAHSIDRVGKFATRFFRRIESLEDLIVALRTDRYEPVAYDPYYHRSFSAIVTRGESNGRRKSAHAARCRGHA